MHAWQSIQETIEYIEQHYGEAITIDQLASMAHLSKYYYQRLFYRLVKKTVYEYIQLRRLLHSVNLLKNTKKTILEIALESGFQTHGHFTKIFKKTYQITPTQYRNGEYQLDSFIKPSLSLKYIDTGVPLVVDGMVLEIRQEQVALDVLYVGKSRLSPIDKIGQSKTNQLVELWKQLPTNSPQAGVDILTLSKNEGYFDYFVGIEGKQ